MLLWVVVHSIFEEASAYAYPIVVHQFYGRTQEEAEGYFRAHKRTDEFLRGCDDKGKWKMVTCKSVKQLFRFDTETRQFLVP